MNQRAHNKMIRARSELVLEHPFFAHLAMRLKLREDTGCSTAWSDGRTLGYNPFYVESMPLAKVMGMQCHEVLHLACGHHVRRGEREPGLWNRACDYAINPVLLEAGLELPHGYLDDPARHGRSADAIYADLAAERDEIKGGALGGPEQEVQFDDDSDSEGADDEDRDQAREGDGKQAAGPDDEPADQEDDSNPDPGMAGEVRDAPADPGDGDGSEARDATEDAWRSAAAQALHKAREFGEMPGSLERLLGRETAPSQNWRELLRRFLDNAARNDFSWLRPNRRFLHAGIYLPGLENRELAEVAVAVDVSGSITQPELDAFAVELSAVLEEFDAPVTVFTCDAAVTRRERLSRWDLPLEFHVRGGGGTDFRPPFLSLERDGAVPACLIYFTDLECSAYPVEPDYPVLWVTANPGHTPPPFGEVVVMEQAMREAS